MTAHLAATQGPSRPSRRLSGGASISAASRISVTIAGGIVAITLARELGPRGWGSYAVAQSFAAVLLVGSSLGVEHGIAYFVSSSRWAARTAFASAMRVALCTGAAGAGLGITVRILAPSAFAGLPVWLTALVAAALPLSLAWYYTSFVALAIDRYEAAMTMPALQAVLVLAFAVPGAAVAGVAGAVVGATMAAVVVGLGAAAWGNKRLPAVLLPTSTRLTDALSFGIKGYGANALQMVNYRLDLFILSSVATTATVGRYSVAVAVTSLLWPLPNALSDVVFPRIARLSGTDETMTRAAIEAKSIRHTSLIVSVAVLALAVGLEFLVVPVFGASFRPSARLGLILLPGAAAVGLASVLSAILAGRGKPAYSLYSSLATAPVTVALYATLIPRFSATGAAVASTLSYCASLLIACAFYRRIVGRAVLSSFIPTRSEAADLRSVLGALVRKGRDNA